MSEKCYNQNEIMYFFIFFFFFWSICLFLGPHLQHMEVPRLGVDSSYSCWPTPDLSHVCDLHHNSWECQIFNPLSKARDPTCILLDISQICFHRATMGTPGVFPFLDVIRSVLATVFLGCLKRRL